MKLTFALRTLACAVLFAVLPWRGRWRSGRIARPMPKASARASRRAKTSTPGQPSDKTTTPAQRQDYAMAEAIDIYGTAFKNGSVTLLARIVGQNGATSSRPTSTPSSTQCTCWTIKIPTAAPPVAGHADVTLPVADVIFNTLQTDAIWTVDATATTSATCWTCRPTRRSPSPAGGIWSSIN